MKKNHNHRMTKTTDFMKNTQFKVEELFDNFLKEYSVSQKVFFNVKFFLPKRCNYWSQYNDKLI